MSTHCSITHLLCLPQVIIQSETSSTTKWLIDHEDSFLDTLSVPFTIPNASAQADRCLFVPPSWWVSSEYNSSLKPVRHIRPRLRKSSSIPDMCIWQITTFSCQHTEKRCAVTCPAKLTGDDCQITWRRDKCGRLCLRCQQAHLKKAVRLITR